LIRVDIDILEDEMLEMGKSGRRERWLGGSG
jgi:hypothetical protein